MNQPANLGEAIRLIRDAKGMTRDQVVEGTDLSSFHLHRLETRETNVSHKMLERIGMRLGVPAWWFYALLSPGDFRPSVLKVCDQVRKQVLLSLKGETPAAENSDEKLMAQAQKLKKANIPRRIPGAKKTFVHGEPRKGVFDFKPEPGG